MKKTNLLLIAGFTALMLSACGGSGGGSSSTATSPGNNNGSNGSGDNSGNPPPASQGRVFHLKPGPDVTNKALRAFIEARPKDVIEFACGFYDIKKTLLLTQTEAVTIKGCGKDGTVLSFRNSEGNPVGLLVDNARGITIKDLTVADTDGDAFELRNVDHGTLDGVRAYWSSGGGRSAPDPVSNDNFQDGRLNVACTAPAIRDPAVPENALLGGTTSPDYTVSDKSGRYGIYPVLSQNILVTHSESIGASDAGIYVGQTNNTIIEHSRSAYNVFGFEIENVRHGEYRFNTAECNTGGFLVYDLDNLTRYGQRTIVHDNISRMNNTYNFTAGGFVSNVPSGSGMVTLAYDGIDVYNNQFLDNNTAGIIHASYQVFPEGAGRPTDKKIDFFTEGLHIFNNKFRNNGNNISLPTTTDLQNGDITHILPLALGLKTALACTLDLNNALTKCPIDGKVIRGAHIIWDGYMAKYNPDCKYPKDKDGNDIPQETGLYAGKPRFSGDDPQPDCHYNAYKFQLDQPKKPFKAPLYYASCIDADNDFGPKSVKFSNFHGTDGLDAVITLLGDDPVADLLKPATLQTIITRLPNFPADLRIAAHRCEQRFGKNLPRIEEVTIPEFVPSGDFDPAPSAEQVKEMCEADLPASQVNFDALASVNCPRLDQYHLFADAADPTSAPNGERSFPYVLNTKLFSDYSVKYRVVFLPPGEQMTYNAPGADSPVSALIFPDGAVIAKTFSFEKNGEETPIETRLLVKRRNSSGDIRWTGLPYVWQTDDQGKPIAVYTPEGEDNIHAEWNYADVNTSERLSGTTENYSVPTANQCLTCHANNDRPGGSAPIGPKVRNMNRPYQSEVEGDTSDQASNPIAGSNQIAYLCNKGWMSNCPADMGVDTNTQVAKNLPRLPKYKVPGDSGFPAGSDKDIEARTRAWLEVNCEHCHNPQGFAASTGLFLDTFRAVNGSYGVCKKPAAAGSKGSGGRQVDIHPGAANKSIITYRIGPDADTAAARMPPIARSIPDTQAFDLLTQWVNTVVDNSYDGASGCSGN